MLVYQRVILGYFMGHPWPRIWSLGVSKNEKRIEKNYQSVATWKENEGEPADKSSMVHYI
jgi:hypothetical protein